MTTKQPKSPIGPTQDPGGFPPNPADRLRSGSVPTRSFPTITISRPLGRCVEEYQETEVPYDEDVETVEEEAAEHKGDAGHGNY